MANTAVSYSVKTMAIIHLIGHSSITQGEAFYDLAGIYNPAGPNPPHSVSCEEHAFWWYQFSCLVLKKDKGEADGCDVLWA